MTILGRLRDLNHRKATSYDVEGYSYGPWTFVGMRAVEEGNRDLYGVFWRP